MPALVSSAPATAHPTHPAALWFTSLVCAMTVLDAHVVGIVLPALSRALGGGVQRRVALLGAINNAGAAAGALAAGFVLIPRLGMNGSIWVAMAASAIAAASVGGVLRLRSSDRDEDDTLYECDCFRVVRFPDDEGQVQVCITFNANGID